MLFPITEHFAKSDHNSSFYLACGPETGPLIIFVYGWPDLATNCAASLPSASAASPRICDAIHDCFRNEGHAYRRNLKRKFLDLENAIRHSLKTFGIRIKGAGRGGFAQAVREAVANDPLVTELIDAMLNARAALWKEYRRLHDLVIKFVAGHELCRRFMQIPGVGPVAALSFVTAIDDPSRFKRSRDVAAYFGLTSRRWQLLDRREGADQQGRRWRRPRGLYEAASAVLTRFKRKDKVKTWGMAIAKRSSHRKATVAVARKLAVIMHAMWVDGTFYCGDPTAKPADVRAHAAVKEGKLLRRYA
jgi:transposase